jgi:hypothetical protein
MASTEPELTKLAEKHKQRISQDMEKQQEYRRRLAARTEMRSERLALEEEHAAQQQQAIQVALHQQGAMQAATAEQGAIQAAAQQQGAMQTAGQQQGTVNIVARELAAALGNEMATEASTSQSDNNVQMEETKDDA